MADTENPNFRLPPNLGVVQCPKDFTKIIVYTADEGMVISCRYFGETPYFEPDEVQLKAIMADLEKRGIAL